MSLRCLRRKRASVWALHGANPILHHPCLLLLGMQEDCMSTSLQLSWFQCLDSGQRKAGESVVGIPRPRHKVPCMALHYLFSAPRVILEAAS